MRSFEKRSLAMAMAKPDFSKRDDVVLNRFGHPDTLILVQGRRLFAHYDILSLYSKKLRDDLHSSSLDPIWGRTLHIRGRTKSAADCRTVEGVIAWLHLIYPPQVMPQAHLLPEVNQIASDFRMDTVIAQMKLSISAHCDLHSVAEVEQQALATGFTEVPPIPEVVFDALSEFSVDELKKMSGYSELSPAAKVEVARRRVLFLEQLFETSKAHSRDCHKTHVLRECVTKHPQMFRECPVHLRHDLRLGSQTADEDCRSVETPSPAATSAGMRTSTYASTTDRTRRPQSAYSGLLASQAVIGFLTHAETSGVDFVSVADGSRR